MVSIGIRLAAPVLALLAVTILPIAVEAAPTWSTVSVSASASLRTEHYWHDYGAWHNESYTYWGSSSWGIFYTNSTYFADLRVTTCAGAGWYGTAGPYTMTSWGKVTGTAPNSGGATVPLRVNVIEFQPWSNVGNYVPPETVVLAQGRVKVRDLTDNTILQDLAVGSTGLLPIIEAPVGHSIALEAESVTSIAEGVGGVQSLQLRVRLEYSADLGRGDVQGFPVLPSGTLSGGGFAFSDIASGQWFDPPAVDGYDYRMTSASLFTRIGAFPDGFASTFMVTAGGELLGPFGPGASVDFLAALGHGVTEFRVTGIAPAVDAEDPTAFPLQIEFDSANASFQMTPVPEPASIVLLAAGALSMLRRRR